MTRSQSPVLFLLFAVVATACAQQGGSAQDPAQLGAAPAVKPADVFPYRFSGGSGSASFTFKGKDDSCSGTLTFASSNVIYVNVDDKGNVVPGALSHAQLVGTSTCKGKAFEFPEVFDLDGGSIKADKIDSITGKPPSGSILGSLKMSGTTCDATVHIDHYISSGSDSRVQVNSLTITHMQKLTGC